MDINLKSQIASAALPIEKATGMPNWFYTSPDAIIEEKRKVFAPNWVGIGFGKDVP